MSALPTSRIVEGICRLYRRLLPADRGWRATLLGVGISLVFAVGPP